MLKRETVIRMLKKRLGNSISSLKYHNLIIDNINIMGGIRDEHVENQFKINMETDIKELELCIKTLKESK